jgi:hypothetical protein
MCGTDEYEYKIRKNGFGKYIYPISVQLPSLFAHLMDYVYRKYFHDGPYNCQELAESRKV